jgi:hypothetical protein
VLLLLLPVLVILGGFLQGLSLLLHPHTLRLGPPGLLLLGLIRRLTQALETKDISNTVLRDSNKNKDDHNLIYRNFGYHDTPVILNIR